MRGKLLAQGCQKSATGKTLTGRVGFVAHMPSMAIAQVLESLEGIGVVGLEDDIRVHVWMYGLGTLVKLWGIL